MRVIRNVNMRVTHLSFMVIAGLLAGLMLTPNAVAQDTTEPDTLLSPAQWRSFETNVKQGIRSENQGVMESALGQIAKFGAYMDFEQDDVIRVVRIYREHGVFRVRHQAVTAIGQMNSRWGIEFLDMLANTETSESMQRTMRTVVDEYWKSHGGNPYQDG